MGPIFVAVLLFVFSVWSVVISIDKRRIRKYLLNRGDSASEITWKIFGKGWFAESTKQGGGNRIYKIAFRDTYGNLKQAWCKTALLSGVFIMDEVITEPATISGRAITDAEKVVILEDELRKLKAERNS